MADRTEQSIRIALEYLLENIDRPPEPNCSCHLSPPCNDCVNHGGLRNAIENAEQALAPAPPAPRAPTPPPCSVCRALTTLVCANARCGNRPAELPAFPINQSDEE